MKDEVGRQKEIDLKSRTKAFALRIIKLYAALPKSVEAQVLGKQLLRSGTSIWSALPRSTTCQVYR